MRGPGWLRRWREVALAAGVVLIAVGPGWREDRESCHLCRARRRVATTQLLGVLVARWDTVDHPGRLGPHVHRWWRYSVATRTGLGGWLGKAVGCQTSRYHDGGMD